MNRTLLCWAIIPLTIACNPDGTCELPVHNGADGLSCLDAAERSCSSMKGIFTAGKKCSQLSRYEQCSGGWYEHASDMCKPLPSPKF